MAISHIHLPLLETLNLYEMESLNIMNNRDTGPSFYFFKEMLLDRKCLGLRRFHNIEIQQELL